MALHRILVVDDSPAIRETVGILLSAEYDVTALRVGEYLSQGTQAQPGPSLIIAGADDRMRTARTTAAGVPVLWLQDWPDSSPETHPMAEQTIARRFSPHELRSRVATLVSRPRPPATVQPDGQRLRPPYLPAQAAAMVAEALTTDLPLHLCGEPGSGKRSVAYAVHTARGGGGFLATTGSAYQVGTSAVKMASHRTIFIDAVDQLPEDAQQHLLGCLDPSGTVRTPEGTRLRLVTAAACDLETILDDRRFCPELYYRLTILTARLPPLRERPEDIPGITGLLASELAHWLDLPQVTFTQRALDRLSRYLWFGNLAELEAVLMRTLSIRRRADIDAEDLLFERTRLPLPHGKPPATVSGLGVGPQPVSESLDLIINELAHEFKNPLATIKAFAQHLRRVLHDGADQHQLVQLTGEAVEQIDATLENLLQFTRFNSPELRSVPLPALLTPVLSEHGKSIERRGGHLDYQPPPPVAVRVDPDQVTYALDNLLKALSRGARPKDPLTVRYFAPANISIQLPNGSKPLGSHLATLLSADATAAAAETLPLGVAIADAVLERNGARLTIAHRCDPTIVTVRFALADD